MFTQPKTCCFCFSLRVGTYILVSLCTFSDLASGALLVAMPDLFEFSHTVMYVMAGIFFCLGLLDVLFLVGATKVLHCCLY